MQKTRDFVLRKIQFRCCVAKSCDVWGQIQMQRYDHTKLAHKTSKDKGIFFYLCIVLASEWRYMSKMIGRDTNKAKENKIFFFFQ